MAVGRISLKVDSPFRDMLIVLRRVPTEASRQAMKYARAQAQPIFRDEMASRARTTTQRRVLADTARVSATARNVSMKAASVGRLSSGTAADDLKVAAEFGVGNNAKVTVRRGGTTFTRRLSVSQFGSRTPRGKVFFPAAIEAASRILSVIIQSAYRSLYDALEEKR